jgi:hypothetical protein
MQAAEVNTRLEQALSRLMLRDSHLLTVDASERSMTHQLAVHPWSSFPVMTSTVSTTWTAST